MAEDVGSSAANPLSSHLSRRSFFAIMGAFGFCPLVSACEFVEVFDTDVGGEAAFDLSMTDFEGLNEIGGTACIAVGSLDILLVRVEEDLITGFERFCPHFSLDMGDCGSNPRPAEWDAEAKELTCTHHFSRFALDGSLVNGPATRAIQVFPVDFDPATGLGTITVGRGGGEQ
ncbi:MAG: Rieske (2Fe-2S) protein [Bradymonadaceae bacterium]